MVDGKSVDNAVLMICVDIDCRFSTGKIVIFKCPFLHRAHIIEQTPIKKVSTSGANYTAESTEAM